MPMLKSRCSNETIDDAGAFVRDLLAAHPDIAARDFLPHAGKQTLLTPRMPTSLRNRSSVTSVSIAFDQVTMFNSHDPVDDENCRCGRHGRMQGHDRL